jgi:signal transduction histidine kinase/DNA-binding response OmpR family regulator/ligand-binding sensor domain-containing protein
MSGFEMLKRMLTKILTMPNSHTTSLKRGIFLAILLHFIFLANAQELIFSPVEGRQQLNEEKIRNFIELPDGRIGVFTEGMFNIYDGATFKNVHIDDTNAIPVTSYTGFHHSYIENNRVWFKCLGKLALINLSTEKCEKAPYAILKKLGFKDSIKDLFVDTAGDIWTVSAKNELNCYQQQTGTIKYFLKSVLVPTAPDARLYDLLVTHNKVYLFYSSGLLRCFDRSSAKELYSTNLADNTTKDLNHWLHAACHGKYIYITRAGHVRGQLLRYDTELKTYKTLIGLQDYWLNSFTINNNGDAVMSCQKGLWFFTPGATNGRYIPELEIAGGHKIKTEVSTVLYDRQGGFWVGTLNKGLYYYHPERFRFQKVQKNDFPIANIYEIQVNTFAETSEIVPLLRNVNCTSILKDRNNIIWIATSKGLYTLTNNKISRQFAIPVSCLYESHEGTLYAGTIDSGLYNFEKKSGTFKQCQPAIALPNIKQITEFKGQLVGLCNRGAFIIEPKSQKPLMASAANMPMFNQPNRTYTCILTDSKNNLWVGTYDGLTMWDSKNEKQYSLDTDNGLVNNSVKSIVEDKDHTFWVTTSRGISHIFVEHASEKYTFKLTNYNIYTGVLEHPFVERASFLSSQSGLFFGGIDGINMLNSQRSVGKEITLKPVFNSFRLIGKNMAGSAGPEQEILMQSISSTDTLHLKYNQNFFTVGFSGLNYLNPAQTYFRYKLDGIDNEWRTVQTASGIWEATYTSIPPGDYVLKVQASTDGIAWKGSVKSLTIIISPPWWKTIPAKIAYIGIFIGLAVFITLRIQKYYGKIRQKKHEEAVEKAKSDFITNMSHELRTPLTLIISPLKSLISKVGDSGTKNELLRISNNANLLLGTVNQLLDFKKVDTGTEVLQAHFCDSLVFIIELCKAYQEAACEKGIQFNFTVPEGEVKIYLDRQKVIRVIVNLLSNAIKFTPSGGNVELAVVLNKTQDKLIIRVKDSGIGIAANELPKIFERFYQTENIQYTAGSGIGLFLVKEYAELHKGNIEVESTAGEGSTFTVTLKVNEEQQEEIPALDNNVLSNTILIIEDHPSFRKYLKDELKPFYNVISAENGKIGLEKALASMPDLIISDMMMPEMDGTVFCRAVRSSLAISHTPVIMLTGRTSDEARFAGYESGADAYLVKPFDINLLLLRISKLLEISEKRRRDFVTEDNLNIENVTNSPLDRDLLERAIRYVESNISNADYSVEKFSADMGMDRTGLYRKLMALTGQSPAIFIRTIRLKKAVELLCNTYTSIADISDEVGFNSLSYFTKCFHESYGKTPSQFREDKTIKK